MFILLGLVNPISHGDQYCFSPTGVYTLSLLMNRAVLCKLGDIGSKLKIGC